MHALPSEPDYPAAEPGLGAVFPALVKEYWKPGQNDMTRGTLRTVLMHNVVYLDGQVLEDLRIIEADFRARCAARVGERIPRIQTAATLLPQEGEEERDALPLHGEERAA